MKSIVFAFMMTVGLAAQAAQPTDIEKALEIIKTGNEPALYVKAFEARGDGLRCDAIKDDAVELEKIEDGIYNATIHVYCNQYDEEGSPMANVYFLKFEGSVYVEAKFFIIDSMVVLPQE